MRCNCGLWTEVIDSRKMDGSYIRRRRACANGHKMTTYETARGDEDAKKMTDMTVIELNNRAMYISNLIAEKLKESP